MGLFLSLRRHGQALDAKAVPYWVCLGFSALAAFWCLWAFFFAILMVTPMAAVGVGLTLVWFAIGFGLMVALQSIPFGTRQVAVLRQRWYVDDDTIVPYPRYSGGGAELVLAQGRIRGAVILMLALIMNGALCVFIHSVIRWFVFNMAVRAQDYPGCWSTRFGMICADPNVRTDLNAQVFSHNPLVIVGLYVIPLIIAAWVFMNATGSVRLYDSFVTWIERPGTVRAKADQAAAEV